MLWWFKASRYPRTSTLPSHFLSSTGQEEKTWQKSSQVQLRTLSNYSHGKNRLSVMEINLLAINNKQEQWGLKGNYKHLPPVHPLLHLPTKKNRGMGQQSVPIAHLCCSFIVTLPPLQVGPLLQDAILLILHRLPIGCSSSSTAPTRLYTTGLSFQEHTASAWSPTSGRCPRTSLLTLGSCQALLTEASLRVPSPHYTKILPRKPNTHIHKSQITLLHKALAWCQCPSPCWDKPSL